MKLPELPLSFSLSLSFRFSTVTPFRRPFQKTQSKNNSRGGAKTTTTTTKRRGLFLHLGSVGGHTRSEVEPEEGTRAGDGDDFRPEKKKRDLCTHATRERERERERAKLSQKSRSLPRTDEGGWWLALEKEIERETSRARRRSLPENSSETPVCAMLPARCQPSRCEKHAVIIVCGRAATSSLCSVKCSTIARGGTTPGVCHAHHTATLTPISPPITFSPDRGTFLRAHFIFV